MELEIITINGNDPDAIRAALKEAKATEKQPTLIISKTIMGKGAHKATIQALKVTVLLMELLWAVTHIKIQLSTWAEILRIHL